MTTLAKTPWNPSRTATARVKNPLPQPEHCRYCGGEVAIMHHDQLYGRTYSDWPWAFVCTCCRASVGMHPFTGIPLGILANAELKEARKLCKVPFETLWVTGKMTRSEAYEELAKHLGLPAEECHFGWFNVEQCQKARAWAQGQHMKIPRPLRDKDGKPKVRCPQCARWVKQKGLHDHLRDKHQI